MVKRFPPPTMSKTTQNMPKRWTPYYQPLTDWLLWTIIGNHAVSVMDLQLLFAPLYKQWVKHLKIYLKHQIPYYHPLIDWLLGVTIGNHGHSVMDLWYIFQYGYYGILSWHTKVLRWSCQYGTNDNSNATSRGICTVLVFIVVFQVMLHAHCGISGSSQIWVNNHLSNNITDGGAPWWCTLTG